MALVYPDKLPGYYVLTDEGLMLGDPTTESERQLLAAYGIDVPLQSVDTTGTNAGQLAQSVLSGQPLPGPDTSISQDDQFRLAQELSYAYASSAYNAAIRELSFRATSIDQENQWRDWFRANVPRPTYDDPASWQPDYSGYVQQAQTAPSAARGSIVGQTTAEGVDPYARTGTVDSRFSTSRVGQTVPLPDALAGLDRSEWTSVELSPGQWIDLSTMTPEQRDFWTSQVQYADPNDPTNPYNRRTDQMRADAMARAATATDSPSRLAGEVPAAGPSVSPVLPPVNGGPETPPGTPVSGPGGTAGTPGSPGEPGAAGPGTGSTVDPVTGQPVEAPPFAWQVWDPQQGYITVADPTGYQNAIPMTEGSPYAMYPQGYDPRMLSGTLPAQNQAFSLQTRGAGEPGTYHYQPLTDEAYQQAMGAAGQAIDAIPSGHVPDSKWYRKARNWSDYYRLGAIQSLGLAPGVVPLDPLAQLQAQLLGQYDPQQAIGAFGPAMTSSTGQVIMPGQQSWTAPAQPQIDSAYYDWIEQRRQALAESPTGVVLRPYPEGSAAANADRPAPRPVGDPYDTSTIDPRNRLPSPEPAPGTPWADAAAGAAAPTADQIAATLQEQTGRQMSPEQVASWGSQLRLLYGAMADQAPYQGWSQEQLADQMAINQNPALATIPGISVPPPPAETGYTWFGPDFGWQPIQGLGAPEEVTAEDWFAQVHAHGIAPWSQEIPEPPSQSGYTWYGPDFGWQPTSNVAQEGTISAEQWYQYRDNQGVPPPANLPNVDPGEWYDPNTGIAVPLPPGDTPLDLIPSTDISDVQDQMQQPAEPQAPPYTPPASDWTPPAPREYPAAPSPAPTSYYQLPDEYLFQDIMNARQAGLGTQLGQRAAGQGAPDIYGGLMGDVERARGALTSQAAAAYKPAAYQMQQQVYDQTSELLNAINQAEMESRRIAEQSGRSI